jgi:GDPmannose 4,6-dehydratase
MLDANSIDRIIREVRPQEVYNLAAQSGVFASWNEAQATLDSNSLGVVRILDAIRATGGAAQCRLLNASAAAYI